MFYTVQAELSYTHYSKLEISLPSPPFLTVSGIHCMDWSGFLQSPLLLDEHE